MKKYLRLCIAGILCLQLAGNPLHAQDASHPRTATSRDSSDWGLLGLIGLLGLLGLRKKQSEDEA